VSKLQKQLETQPKEMMTIMTIEALMGVESEEHLKTNQIDKGYGYRNRKSLGSGKILDLRVP
jgi:hypothetical protein